MGNVWGRGQHAKKIIPGLVLFVRSLTSRQHDSRPGSAGNRKPFLL